jgi:hypothetical protein
VREDRPEAGLGGVLHGTRMRRSAERDHDDALGRVEKLCCAV